MCEPHHYHSLKGYDKVCCSPEKRGEKLGTTSDGAQRMKYNTLLHFPILPTTFWNSGQKISWFRYFLGSGSISKSKSPPPSRNLERKRLSPRVVLSQFWGQDLWRSQISGFKLLELTLMSHDSSMESSKDRGERERERENGASLKFDLNLRLDPLLSVRCGVGPLVWENIADLLFLLFFSPLLLSQHPKAWPTEHFTF